MLFALLLTTAQGQECFPGAETTAFGVHIEISDGGLRGLDLEMQVDGHVWEFPGQLSRAIDWTVIEGDWTIEDSDAAIRVGFALGRLPTASVDKSGDPWTVIEVECVP